jgi:hypothetical protein
LTLPPDSSHHAAVSTNAQTPLQQTLRWMATHARFPSSRLPDRAELLVLIATAASTESAGIPGAPANAGLMRNKTFNAQIRNYTAMRRRAHINCDNSAKT